MRQTTVVAALDAMSEMVAMLMIVMMTKPMTDDDLHDKVTN